MHTTAALPASRANYDDGIPGTYGVPTIHVLVQLRFVGVLPFDFDLIGTTLNLQALENDPGAAKGVSFTPGLELVLGW